MCSADLCDSGPESAVPVVNQNSDDATAVWRNNGIYLLTRNAVVPNASFPTAGSAFGNVVYNKLRQSVLYEPPVSVRVILILWRSHDITSGLYDVIYSTPHTSSSDDASILRVSPLTPLVICSCTQLDNARSQSF